MALTYADAETCLGVPRTYEEMFGEDPAATYEDFATPCLDGQPSIPGSDGTRPEAPSRWFTDALPPDLPILGAPYASYTLILNLFSHSPHPVVAVPLPVAVTTWNDADDLDDILRFLNNLES